ncbi:muscle LIM protein 1-like [Pocillopora verrucosa]|uniref:muscle LIM protein 1-like n=1 Tax=Pocillopora damicornis TaxID=46731 RepID=UPI000F54F806|nr:muscle LIM protein 1-like [Pocillopora damicornis]XP_058949870.1 muscle LIM protein 1-like [Pocillopora verrucosa]
MSGRCPRCNDRVYAAEQVIAGKNKYHKRCFTCNNKPTCNKSLDSGSFNEHDDQVYCRGCYGKLFGPKGYGYGAGAGALHLTGK